MTEMRREWAKCRQDKIPHWGFVLLAFRLQGGVDQAGLVLVVHTGGAFGPPSAMCDRSTVRSWKQPRKTPFAQSSKG